MDKIFNIDFGGAQADPTVLPKSYDFEWKYTMQMKLAKREYEYDLLPKTRHAKYFGTQPELESKPYGK